MTTLHDKLKEMADALTRIKGCEQTLLAKDAQSPISGADVERASAHSYEPVKESMRVDRERMKQCARALFASGVNFPATYSVEGHTIVIEADKISIDGEIIGPE